MIYITDKHNCCGCSACVQACPKQCISFDEDEQGFRYPLVNKDICTDCSLCEKVCPCQNQNAPSKPLKVYAAINPNEEIRMMSSSGGIFTMLAEAIINEGGVVFGARFDENWELIHDYTETKEGLEAFRGSKYIQSRIGESFVLAREFLKHGRKVLFSGTSCQIAGLKKFLRKDYNNLLSIEILCHSVPSPLIWREYLKEISNGRDVKTINFRDKTTGWTNYSYNMRIEYSDSTMYSEPSSGLYLKGLTSNLTTRPSCSKCPSRNCKSGADIIIGDCWGIWSCLPKMDDNKGTSLIIVLTEYGNRLLETVDVLSEELTFDELTPFNGALREPRPEHNKHEHFFKMNDGTNSIVGLMNENLTPIKGTLWFCMKNRLYIFVRSVISRSKTGLKS